MLVTIAWFSITISLLCGCIILIDEARHPQSMGVMNAVWPVTALYLSVVALWWYFLAGSKMSRDAAGQHMAHMHMHGGDSTRPTWAQSFLAGSHCGAGCALADIVVEFTIFALGLTIAGSTLAASYVWDFIGAWALGIVFQYYSIKPMGNLTVRQAIIVAIKADTLSIIAFQVGMYAWMAVTHFWLFPRSHLLPLSPVFWFMMQIGMVLGLLTTSPMNRWLVSVGLKEKMG
ncbi:MAG TPA: DUF4396 domain-containing protein [Acidobacteriaceae bacterium]|nr:DUF4396 domain-containing protein [Acidobacteriaceae bacterium]